MPVVRQASCTRRTVKRQKINQNCFLFYMKTYLDCIPCFMTQTLRTARLAKADTETTKNLLDFTGDYVKHMSLDKTPAELSEVIYREIRKQTGVEDPYRSLKQKSIQEALLLLPTLENILAKSDNKLRTAIKIAIAGNVIDFGMSKQFNINEDVYRILGQDFAHSDMEDFQEHLQTANTILYIGDNAGESVFDKLLIQLMGKKTYYAVREVPVINDVTKQDAIDSGLDQVAEIISSGSHAPGTMRSGCSAEFNALFQKVDMVISKGQGNYEGLSEEKRSVFFLLKAKCPVIAQDIGVAENDIVLKGINCKTPKNQSTHVKA